MYSNMMSAVFSRCVCFSFITRTMSINGVVNGVLDTMPMMWML